MTTRAGGIVLAAASCLTLAARAPLRAQELGTIAFATSGAPAAQPAFLEGVKALHSFEFDEAGESFRKAQQLDPGFALAYWGEAMSYNHPLWAEVEVEKAKKVLEKLAPTREGRIAKGRTPKEQGYLDAVNQLFYAPGEKLARDDAYSRTMSRMYAAWPDDHEVATFYALSLLGLVRPGDQGFRRQALAASIALAVFKENPNHPGAVHFIIHSFDDPDHAPLALPAARVYAKIAPAAPHALHMPSHIFVQLGMWPEVAASNAVAYKAAVDLNARLRLAEGREDFHALSWLEYANLMMGRFDEAKENVERARQALDRNPRNQRVRDGYLGMRARYVLEAAQWETTTIDAAVASADAAADEGMAGMPGMGGRYNGRGAWVFVTGVSAAKRGDFMAAEKAEAELRAMAEGVASSGNAQGAKPFTIMEKEVGALICLARGQKSEAVRIAKEAADLELTRAAPSGPPEPILPALELYGSVLLEANRAKDAAAAFEQQLLRTPNRTPSVKALARAAPQAGALAAGGRGESLTRRRRPG